MQNQFFEFEHASLFSGIGGFDLAAEWMGWNNIFNCEKEHFCQKILKYYWPKAIQYGDIKTTDFTIWRGKINILTGGFPCQPFSHAGKRKGTKDDRHLWPEMLRAIHEIQPPWVIGENVPGLINWDGGLVFEQVQTDLEAEGYEVWPFILPACAVSAPHRRERIWFVAYSNKCIARPSRTSERAFGESGNNNDEPKEWREQAEQHNGYGNVYGVIANPGLFRPEKLEKQATGIKQYDEAGIIANSKPEGFQKPEKNKQQNTLFNDERNNLQFTSNSEEQGLERKNTKRQQCSKRQFVQPDFRKFPTQSPICSRNDGLSIRLDNITFPKWRNESIKGYGNAIVPQVVFQIFKAIQEFEIQNSQIK